MCESVGAGEGGTGVSVGLGGLVGTSVGLPFVGVMVIPKGWLWTWLAGIKYSRQVSVNTMMIENRFHFIELPSLEKPIND